MSELWLARSGEPLPGAAFDAPCYRIPAIAVLPGGRVLVVWDVRADWRDLPGPFDLVIRHSDDHGRTWSPTRYLRRHEGRRGFGDASLLVTGDGRLLCWHVSSDGESFFSATPGGPGLGLWCAVSDDEGLTWTHVAHDQLRPDWVGGMFASSGNGVRLADGRLLQPMVMRDAAGAHWAATARSDDGGASWTLGTPVGPDCDENKVEALADGRVLLHARARPRRRQAWSDDGGASFSAPEPHPALVDPACNGGLLRWNGLLVASLLDDPAQRRSLGIRYSRDDGTSWSASVPVDLGAAAYSVLAPLADGALAIVYEVGDYQGLIFRRIEPGDLGELDGEVRLVPRPGTGSARPPEVAPA